MKKQRIEITGANFDYIVIRPLSGYDLNLLFIEELKVHLSQYLDSGYHYIGWYNDNDDKVNLETYLQHKIVSIVPSIKMYLSYGLTDLGDTSPIPKGLEIIRHFESKGDGVGEISPINAIVGDITTPDSKTHSETVSDNTDKHKTTDDYIKAFKFSEKYKSLVSVIGELICNTIIAEFNTLY